MCDFNPVYIADGIYVGGVVVKNKPLQFFCQYAVLGDVSDQLV